MKRAVIAVMVMLISGISFSQGQKNDCVLYPALIDSVLVAKWNPESQSWIDESIRHYRYNESRLSSILYMDAARVWQSKWEDHYDSSGNVIYQLMTTWNGSAWVESQKKNSEFSAENRKQNELIQNFRNGVWVFRAYYEYYYEGTMLSRVKYMMQDPSGNLYDHLYYDYFYVDGKTTEIHTIDAKTGVITRVEKYLRENGSQVSEVLLYTSSTDSETGVVTLVPVTRRLYDYSEFSLLREVVLMSWNGTEWVNSTRSVYYRKIDFAKKVVICHNGNTLCVSVNAVPAHLAQGDKLGACISEVQENNNSQKDESGSNKTVPFVVFPNPAREMVTVRINDAAMLNIGTIQLTDFNGKILRNIDVSGQNEITIYRNGLKEGKYFLRLSGGEVFHAVVIFK